MIRTYYQLTKPGIIYGNVLTTAAGFFFASSGSVEWGLFVAVLVGLLLIIACGCVCNNILDRDMDARMERTKNRAMAKGSISTKAAWLFAVALGVAGTLVLFLFVTPLALGVALFGLFVYVALYTPLKPHSATALFVGALAGATPPVVGYVAVTHALDGYALALFGALYLWQIPHFLAISLYRFDEYKAAGVPLFIHRSPSARVRYWARQVFHLSLVVMVVACGALMLQI